MQGKRFYKVICLIAIIEFFFLLYQGKVFEVSYVLPRFCSTFTNDSCLLDYEESQTSFLSRYEDYCNSHMRVDHHADACYHRNESLCPCVPDDLLTHAAEVAYKRCHDGFMRPLHCIPRHKSAIIIPFRDRHHHFKLISKVLHKMLRKQLLSYQIFLVEQEGHGVFNKAVLMNAGFKELSRHVLPKFTLATKPIDCYIFHDVDMLPLEPFSNFYVCVDMPRHVGAFQADQNFQLIYDGIFGGATAFKAHHFETLNGFSNTFWGWGGEDDDMLLRVKACNMSVNRFPRSVARYRMVSHSADRGNPGSTTKSRAFDYDRHKYQREGLNSVRYQLLRWRQEARGSRLLVRVPPSPAHYSTYDRAVWFNDALQSDMHAFLLLLFLASVLLLLFLQKICSL